MNVDKILAVADAIEQHTIPDLGFNMDFMLNPRGDASDHSGHNCGTVACIAGWAYAIERDGAINGDENYDAEMPARAFLGLDAVQARKLFYPLSICDWDEIAPASAVRVLRNLAITGKVDWEAAMKDNDPVMPALPQPVVQCSTEDVS